MIANSVQREDGIRYGVRLAGRNVAAGIRPENLRPVRCSAAQLADPGYRDKPQELRVDSGLVQVHRGSGDNGRSANVVTFKSEDIQKEGAYYRSTELDEESSDEDMSNEAHGCGFGGHGVGCACDFGSVACNIVLHPRTMVAVSKEDAWWLPQEEKDASESVKPSEPAARPLPDSDQPVLRCTCCEWCRLQLQCNRSSKLQGQSGSMSATRQGRRGGGQGRCKVAALHRRAVLWQEPLCVELRVGTTPDVPAASSPGIGRLRAQQEGTDGAEAVHEGPVSTSSIYEDKPSAKCRRAGDDSLGL